MENIQLILPEIFLSLSIMFLLIFGVFKKNSSKLVQNLSLAVLIVTAVITFNENIGINETKLFNNSIIIDYLSSLMKIITLHGDQVPLLRIIILTLLINKNTLAGVPLTPRDNGCRTASTVVFPTTMGLFFDFDGHALLRDNGCFSSPATKRGEHRNIER